MSKDTPASPSLVEQARTLSASQRFGTLSTHSRDYPEFPFGSLVAYASEPDGNVLLLLSSLAVHTRNIEVNDRVSLLVTGGATEALASPRLTLLGAVATIRDGLEAPRQLYLERHPEAQQWATFGDFRLLRLQVARAYYVAGFGSMGWIEAEAYAAAEPDPLIPHADGIIEHMNSDHADAVLLYAKVYGGVDATSARLLSVDRLGMRIGAGRGDSTEILRVAFPTECRTTDAVRKATIELLRAARAQLGTE